MANERVAQWPSKGDVTVRSFRAHFQLKWWQERERRSGRQRNPPRERSTEQSGCRGGVSSTGRVNFLKCFKVVLGYIKVPKEPAFVPTS